MHHHLRGTGEIDIGTRKIAMLKGFLITTTLGQIAFNLRDSIALHKAVSSDLENVGAISNDILSRILLDRLCEDDKIFVDVGAHIGSVIAGTSRHSKPSRIIAVEAIPEKAQALRQRFPKATILETAVGDHDGEVDFTIDLARPGYSSLDPDVQSRTTASRIIRVKMTTLDAIVPRDDVSLIKIDVEGAELGVLRGAEAIVARSRPVFMFESGPTEMAGFPMRDLWQWFQDHDYEVALPMRVAHNAPGLSLETFLDSHAYPRVTTNYFGIPRERRAEVRLRARRVLKLD